MEQEGSPLKDCKQKQAGEEPTSLLELIRSGKSDGIPFSDFPLGELLKEPKSDTQ